MKIKFWIITLILISISITFTTYIIGKNVTSIKQEVEVAYDTTDTSKLIETADIDNLLRDELLDSFLDIIELMNKEHLPFDEPKTEFGQQDGILRSKWKDAYFTGKTKFKFNDDTYYVFRRLKKDNRLYPFIPQVCSDYLIDAIDRSLGNWYYPSTRKPHYVKGKYSIQHQAKKEGYNLRRLHDVVKYMKSHPEHYEFVFEGDGIEIGNTKKLKAWFNLIDVQLGDLILIGGRVPWDNKLHSHSFIVSKMTDGYVNKVSGNAGMAREWNLEVESYRTPLRKVNYVIRLKNDLLIKMIR